MLSHCVFWLGLATFFYALALYVAVLRIVREHRAPSKVVNGLLGAGMVLHLVGIIVSGHPLAILAHVLSELAFLILVIYLIMQWRGRWGALSIFILPTVLVLCVFSLFLPHEYEGVGITHILFAVHILLSLAGIGGIFTGLFYTFLYMMQEHALKSRKPGPWFHLIPSLHASERFAWRSLLGGWFLYTLGVATGSLWSYFSKGAWMTYNTKQVGGITAWVVFLLLVLAQHLLRWRGSRAVALYLVGFLFLILAFTGIRLG